MANQEQTGGGGQAVEVSAGPATAPEPELALAHLAATLRAERSVISPHVVEPDAEPALGLLAAAGPRATVPGEYALLVETIREGYLLHYGAPRVLRGQDRDLGLLCGDYLYARGLERLAALGDLGSVHELSDLISLSARVHGDGAPERAGAPLWLAAVTTVACGPDPGHEQAKEALRQGDDAAAALWRVATRAAERCGLGDPLRRAADAIDFQPLQDPDLG